MPMPFAMVRAFVGASPAERDAVGELGFEKLAVPGLVRSRHDAASGAAHRRAVEVEADAPDEALDVAFRQARIGAGGAGFDAAKASIDATAHRLGVGGLFRMRAEHGADGDCGHGFSSLLAPRSLQTPSAEDG